MLELFPWWGGFYERLVRVVKNAIRKLLIGSRISYDELVTILVEVENIIISTSLTYQIKTLHRRKPLHRMIFYMVGILPSVGSIL